MDIGIQNNIAVYCD